jgi:CRISPR/Cas system CSM-associated protein Csm2 small subunit
METLQHLNYKQTIIKATLDDETEKLIEFLEELIKKMKGDKDHDYNNAYM